MTLPTGDVVSATVEGTVTNVADSADDNNVVTAVVITNASGTQTNDQYKTVTLVPGALKITKRGAGEMKVVLTAADNTVVYDGQPHGARLNAAGQIEADTSYTITNLAEGQRVQTVAINGTETAVGEYPNKLVPNGAVIVDANDTDVTANYEITYLPGTLTITEVTDEVVVTITEASGTVVYDGQEHSVKGYVSMVSSNPLYDATTSVLAVETAAWTAKGTNVGEYPVGIKAADFENTNTSFTNVRFVIVDGALNITPVTDKVTVTVVENSDTVTYDGQEHSVTGYKSMTANNALYNTADVAETPTEAWTAKGTNVGEYPVGIKAGDFKNTSVNFTNVEFVIVDGTLKIDPITDKVTVTVTEKSDTVVYDTNEHSITGYKSMTANNALYNTADVAETPTEAWTAKGTNAGEYPVGIKAGDFKNTSVNFTNVEFIVVDGTLEITPVTEKVTVTITENSDTVVYDTKEHTVTGYKSMTADNALYDVTKNVAGTRTAAWTAKGVEAGEYPVGIAAGDFKNTSANFTNVEFVIVDGALVIEPDDAEVIVTITGNTASKVYNGEEKSVTGYTTDVGTKTISVKLNETGKDTAKGTNAGRYMMGLTAKDFTVTSENYSNIKVIVVDGYLDITPITKEVVVTITGNKDTKVYSGKEQSVIGYTTDVGTKTISVKLNETGKDTAKGTNAGRYMMGLTAKDFTVTSKNYSNIKVIVNDGYLDITPITDRVTVTVTEKSASHVYNGTERSITGYKSMTADNALYNVKTNVAETPTDKWTAKGTNTGKYQVGIKAGDFKNTSGNFTNVVFVIVDGALEITPVTSKVTVTVTEKSGTVTYDAKLHSITGYESMTADNALYDVTKNVAGTRTAAWTAKGVEAGEYPVGIAAGDFKNTSANFTNVEFVIVDGALVIEPDDAEVIVTITGNTKTVTYDGKEHSVEGYKVDVNGLPITVTPKANLEAKASGTNAGTYYMGLTAADFTATSNNYSNIKIVVNDGYLKINPITATVTVTIVENKGTVEYDGKQHTVKGYVSMTSDHPLYDVANVAETPTAAWTAKGTDAGKYPVGIESGDFKNTSGNFANVEFKIVDGALTITRRGENPESPVTLRAKDGTVVFDGKYHGYVGQTATNLAEGHSVRSVESDFTARNVGLYTDKIDLHDAVIVDANGRDVTHNYVLTYIPGTLEITPYEGEVLVTVTGSNGVFRYNGMNHTVSGYTMEASVPFFTMNDIRFTGKAEITKARPGDYMMGLKTEDFSVANGNFTNVKFTVIDGGMRIYTVRYTVAWMFDTDQMLTGDASNRYFSAMADYIDRSDISLVLHTGNVVADAKDQSQWDVYNNAMQSLYDDEDTDVLMIAADKEAADGSLFLQQPVREDFKEEDLFENGKGFVRRFNIGEKSVILVGLGADALTEEGYKWAREKFDSDKDASGILMVNTYLLEDMTKDEKIDESALDIEKEIVKACSNVRMVLSSSGGYSSHYEFFYGERKVIAINSDIEAAAKAGYFTMLTFNEDLNILSVTNLCPYTYDFVYNERQAYKECYVLNDVL